MDKFKFDPKQHYRHSIRLQGYDYSSEGAYFITICTKERQCILGNVMEEKMFTNPLGKIAEECWNDIPKYYPLVQLDAFVVMPNHIHGVLLNLGQAISLGNIIGYFKYQSTKKIFGLPGNKILFRWQRNYYEHVIRDEKDLAQIREYIQNNPLK
jgi:REP element-mobilizing transposase RayT